jgi:sialidase-1
MALVPGRVEASAPGGGCDSVPFRRNDNGYAYFRIPAMVRIADGTLLAFAEGRKDGGGDSGNIDLVLRRSRDDGCSWESLIVVSDHGRDTIGNPTPVYDEITGQVVLLATGNGGKLSEREIRGGRATALTTRRVYRLISGDGGLTWSEREITRSVKRPGWRWYATGPGHAVQLTGGRYSGRLVATGVHTIPPARGQLGTNYKYSGAHSLISDDHGETWRLGFVDRSYDGWINTNETAVAQLADGRLYFNSRDQQGRAPGNRAVGWSRTGGNTLSGKFVSARRTAAPMVQCSVLSLGNTLIFAGPSSLDGTRSRLTVRSTPGDGSSGRFTAQRMLWNGFAAYSDLVPVGPATVGVLYERGRTSPYDEIGYQSVPIGALPKL